MVCVAFIYLYIFILKYGKGKGGSLPENMEVYAENRSSFFTYINI